MEPNRIKFSETFSKHTGLSESQINSILEKNFNRIKRDEKISKIKLFFNNIWNSCLNFMFN